MYSSMMILRVSRASSDLGHRKLQLSSSMAAQSATISIRPGRPSRYFACVDGSHFELRCWWWCVVSTCLRREHSCSSRSASSHFGPSLHFLADRRNSLMSLQAELQ